MRNQVLSLICFLLGFSSMACSPWPENNTEKVKIPGTDSWFSIVIYFKKGTTEGQVEAFNKNVLTEPATDRGTKHIDGIGSYLRLTPDQANGHWAIAITFWAKTTDERKREIKELVRSNELIYRVYEEVAPKDIPDEDKSSSATVHKATPSAASKPLNLPQNLP